MPDACSAPIRVLYLRDHIAWSGGTIYFLDTLPKLDPARIQMCFCVLSLPQPEASEFADRGIAPRFIPLRGLRLRSLITLRREIAKFRPDIVHLSGPRAMLYGRLVCLDSPHPMVMLFNNALPEPRLRLWAQRRLPKSNAHGIAVSRAMAAWASDTYGIPHDRIDVIYGGRDLAAFLAIDRESAALTAARVRDQLGIPRDARVLVLSGRVVDKQKGQFGMIRSMQALRARIPEAHLVVVGDGEDLAASRELASKLGLASAVTFTGLRSDMADLLAASDLAVAPSLVEEAFSFAALEASAVGKPVVAFRAGGLPEAVRDGVAGTLVPKGDWSALVNASAAYLSDPDLAERHGNSGRRFAQDLTAASHAERLMRFYESLVQ